MKTQKNIMKGRPAFLVDKHLKKAAREAAEVFKEEEQELKKMRWNNLRKNGFY